MSLLPGEIIGEGVRDRQRDEIPPELDEAFVQLGVANDRLYRGPLFQIHDPEITGTNGLAAHGLMRELRSRDGIQDEAGTRVSVQTQENVEGSYYTQLPEEEAASLRYRIHRGHRATMGEVEFCFSPKKTWGELPRHATPEQLQQMTMRLEAMRKALEAGLSEKKTGLAGSYSTLGEDQREVVATALLELGGKDKAILFGLRTGCWFSQERRGLEIQEPYIEKLDSLLAQVDQLQRLGVRINPAIIVSKVAYINGVWTQVEHQKLDDTPATVSGNAIERLAGIFDWIKGLFGQDKERKKEEEQALFKSTQQAILGKLSLLMTRLSELYGDAQLGHKLSKDEFVATCLKYLGYHEVNPV